MPRAEPADAASSRWKAVGLLIVGVYVAGAALLFWAERGITAYPSVTSLAEIVAILVGFGWFVLVGALVISRQPRNPMGWLLSAIALLPVLSDAGHHYAAYLVIERGYEPGLLIGLAAWPNSWAWSMTTALVFVFLPLFFPTGRLPSRRWRVVAWVGGFAALWESGRLAVAGTIRFEITAGADAVTIPNPLAIESVAGVARSPAADLLVILLVAVVAGSFASLVVRFRRSHGVERQQMKWLVLTVAIVPFMAPLLGFGDVQLGWFAFIAAINAIPLAIGLAVLRYRLYAIDRIINRTVVYAALTVTLAGMYWGLVITLQSLLRPVTAGSDLVVAASTLAVAAAFGPARRRIQRFVDRRFNRARYDAGRTVETFAGRLRDEVDLNEIRERLAATPATALQPASASIWMGSSGAATSALRTAGVPPRSSPEATTPVAGVTT